ncbi:MAG: ATP-binding protein [Armatimonadetes bacterium]|nr:ATP-binding protein [Armatimonadota bacterium]
MGTQANHDVRRWHFRLPSSTLQLAPLRARLHRLLRDLGLPPGIIHDLVLATHEAVVNAMIHGNAQDDTKCVEMTIEVSRTDVVVRVADQGQGFDGQAWLEQHREQPTPPDALRGRGILVMDAVMDDVAFSRLGNVVLLTKRLGAWVKANARHCDGPGAGP